MIDILPLHIRQHLKQFGFSDQDVLIITFLLHFGKASVKEISRQTGISYSTVEYHCHNLNRAGILHLTRRNSKFFYAMCSEEDFLSWIDGRKHRMLEEHANTIEDVKAYFKVMRERTGKPELLYFDGVEEVREIYEDMLKTKASVYGWRDIKILQKALGKEYLASYIERRLKLGIKSFAIMPDNRVNRAYDRKNQNRQAKFDRHLKLPGEIRMFHNKVAIITFQKDHPVGFMMVGDLAFRMFKAIFDLAWKRSPEHGALHLAS